MDALLKDLPKLERIFTYHVVPGRVLSTDLPMKSISADTVAGSPVEVTRNRAGVTVGGAKVVSADLIAGNGVIHVIDNVILPR